MNKDKKKKYLNIADQASYLQSSNTELPESYTIHDGFLFKGETPASLITSGLVENAAQGFLHVDETERYKT